MSVSHGNELQGINSVSTSPSPVTVGSVELVQFAPPIPGAGLEHVRVLVLLPPKHVFEQSVQFPHSAQYPSTRIRIDIFCFCTIEALVKFLI